MSTIAAAITQQITPRPIHAQMTNPETQVGEALLPPLTAVNPSRMKAISAKKATTKETRPATKSAFPTTCQVYHWYMAIYHVPRSDLSKSVGRLGIGLPEATADCRVACQRGNRLLRADTPPAEYTSENSAELLGSAM